MSTAMNRLLWWHWLLIGFGASLVLFLILFFAVIRPKQEAAGAATTEAVSTEGSGGLLDKVDEKKRELKKTQVESAKTVQDWKVESAVYMPPIDFNPDPLRAYEGIQSAGVYHLNGKTYGVKDLPAIWGQWITYWYTSQGIVPATAFPVEAFSSDPNEVSALKSISFPQGKPWDVQIVAKDFDTAMKHLRSFNTMKHHGMPVVDRVALSGQSPNLLMSYTLQLYVIPPTNPPAPDPMIAPGAGGGAGGSRSFGAGMGGAGAMGSMGSGMQGGPRSGGPGGSGGPMGGGKKGAD